VQSVLVSASSRFIVTALFFLSGFSALIYQTVWQRLLGLFGGSDTVSASLVVSAFLAGLGVGSLLAGLFADRVPRRRALLLFALVEILIGAYAAVSIPIFHDVLLGMLIELSRSRALTFVAAFIALLVPTVLMGLSLPLLARALVSDMDKAAGRISVLYGINTLGAGVGALVAGLWLIGSFGYWPAVLWGAACNGIVGLGALVAAGTRGIDRQDDIEAAPASAGPSDASGTVRNWCLLVFASGMLAVALQVAWYRLIGTLLQGNAYGFPYILGLLLVGDAVGLFLGARLVARIADPRGQFIRLQAAMVLVAVLSILVFYRLAGVDGLASLLVNVDRFQLPPANAAAVLATAFVLVVPASILFGLTFPLSQRAVQTDARLVGHRVGMIQLANILGNSIGGLVTGLLLLRFLGTAGTLIALLAAGAAFALVLTLERAPRRRGLVFAAVSVAVMVLVPSNDEFWSRLHGVNPRQSAEVAEDHTGLAVLRRFENGCHRMYIQGHSQSCLPVCTVHAFLGALGPLVHPAPRSVLVVGVGAGGTPYAAGVNPATEAVRAVEIVAPVLDLIDRFAASDGRFGMKRLKEDQRFDIVVGDGRHDLFLAGRSYDVIEADAILPHTAFSGLLYSREYFEKVREHLAPGGIAVQWAPTERTIATFRTVFPYVIYAAPALLGSTRPIPYDPAALARRTEEPAIRDHLTAAEVNLDDLRRFLTGRAPVVWSATAPAADINTDLWPKDEYWLNNTHTPTY
jgi:spermidine synthase/predicted MFS family arabinose efflux permease